MGTPLAYFITFRTYGTWLHGDERGSFDRRHRTYGQEPLATNVGLSQYEQARLKGRPVILDDEARHAVAAAIRETCRSRDWTLTAINVRTNHIHVVLTCSQSAEYVMQRLKAEATKALRREGLAGSDQTLWSRHGSTRYLWDEAAIEAACRYVLEAQ